jgi:hypothetical protein
MMGEEKKKVFVLDNAMHRPDAFRKFFEERKDWLTAIMPADMKQTLNMNQESDMKRVVEEITDSGDCLVRLPNLMIADVSRNSNGRAFIDKVRLKLGRAMPPVIFLVSRREKEIYEETAPEYYYLEKKGKDFFNPVELENLLLKIFPGG